MSEKKIYTFTSENHNYANGDYDFIASDIRDAIKMAREFQREKNIGKNSNYTIEFDFSNIKIFLIEDGFVNIREYTWKK